jgi:hypothetical protein
MITKINKEGWLEINASTNTTHPQRFNGKEITGGSQAKYLFNNSVVFFIFIDVSQ